MKLGPCLDTSGVEELLPLSPHPIIPRLWSASDGSDCFNQASRHDNIHLELTSLPDVLKHCYIGPSFNPTRTHCCHDPFILYHRAFLDLAYGEVVPITIMWVNGGGMGAASMSVTDPSSTIHSTIAGSWIPAEDAGSCPNLVDPFTP